MIPMLRADRKLAVWVAIGTATMLASIGLAGFAVNEHTSAQTDRLDSQRFAIHQTCVAVQNLNKVITQTLRRSSLNLPRLTYYRQHPAELRLQQAEIRRELRVFRPRTCK